MRRQAKDIQKQKNQMPLVCLTAYTAPMASACDAVCDMILVGDSLSMVLYGEDSTQTATLGMMARHGKAVVKASEKALIIVDMPFGSYENDPMKALQSAQYLMDETRAQAVKLEGGAEMAETIELLVQNDIPVVGHIGLLPQSVNSSDGFRVQGRDIDSAQQIMHDAKTIEEAGAFTVVIEAVPEPLAAAVTASVTIPTIGIGASAACDGQILVTEDMLGLSLGKPPKFVKQYANLAPTIETALSQYAQEVKERAFPAPENTYQGKKADKNAA